MKKHEIINAFEEAYERDWTFGQIDFDENMTLKEVMEKLKTARVRISIGEEEINGEYEDLLEFVDSELQKNIGDFVYDTFIHMCEDKGSDYDTEEIMYLKVNGEVYKATIDVEMDYLSEFSCRCYVPDYFSVQKIEKMEVEEINGVLYLKEKQNEC